MKKIMKIFHIILIFALVILGFFGLRGCMTQYYLETEHTSLNPVSYVFTQPKWKALHESDNRWDVDYQFSAEKLEAIQKRSVEIDAFAKEWNILRDSVKRIAPRKEIVRVKRIAVSPDLVMMAPSYYRERYSGNRVEASGRGADKERIHVFYLSDGEIIQASARTNSEWLAVSVGDKVEKTQTSELSAGGTRSITWYPVDSKLSVDWGTYSHTRSVYYPVMTLWKIPVMEITSNTRYRPLFSK